MVVGELVLFVMLSVACFALLSALPLSAQTEILRLHFISLWMTTI